jgi:DNA polymerase epsilon subunit 2
MFEPECLFHAHAHHMPLIFLLRLTSDVQINMLAQRYALIQQRVLRHKFFRPSQDWYKSTTGQLKITPIESLLGQKPGVESPDAITTDAVLLLGVLLQIEQGSYYLEDTTGQVPVCLQYATLTDASFLTEHSILLVEGQVRDGIVYVNRIGQPLQETREQAVRAIQQQVSHPAFVLPKHSSLDKTPFFIFQDLYMDQPRVLQQLESALAYHERRAVELGDAPVFVFMGNFCSPHAQQAAQPTPAALNQLVKSALEDLLTLISRFSTLATIAQFVIVPGPRDTGNRLLPLPPFGFHQSLANSKVANVHWASNPCRMRFTEKEIVVFRYDLLPLLQQHQIRLPSDSNADTTDDGQALELRAPHCRLLKTVLDQGTLMPLTSVVPVYWNYSQAMALYPLPDCLIIGCSSGGRDAQQHQYDSYHNCRVIQTTSYAQENSAYAIYRPNGVDGEDDENRPNGVDGEDDENDLPTMNDAADTHHVGTDDNDDDNDMIIDDFNVEDEVKDTSSRKESAFFGSGKRAKTDRKFAFSKESSPRCIEEELVQQLEDSAENSAPDSETDDGESNPVRANEEDSES